MLLLTGEQTGEEWEICRNNNLSKIGEYCVENIGWKSVYFLFFLTRGFNIQ